MQRIRSAELPAHIGEQVSIAGWVHRRRQLKSITFLIIRDATGLTQVAVTDPAVRATVAGLTEETVVAVTGELIAAPAAPNGVELVAPQLRLLSEPAEPPPFDLYRPTLTANLPTQRDHAGSGVAAPGAFADAEALCVDR